MMSATSVTIVSPPFLIVLASLMSYLPISAVVIGIILPPDDINNHTLTFFVVSVITKKMNSVIARDVCSSVHVQLIPYM